MSGSILIVDDMHDMLKFLERLIKAELHVDVYTTDNGKDAIEMIVGNPVRIVLADIRMPEMNGVELLRRVKEIDNSITIIMMTAYGSIEDAVETLKLGAYDYVTKPFDEERLLHTLKKAIEYDGLVQKNVDLEKKIKAREAAERLVGKSTPIQGLVEIVKVVARTDLTVLVTGETGTGKDIVARMVHALSHRTDGAFVPVNCPAIPENILESELFGYRKGAFTGATQDRKGLFEAADGGTIFLDEIGDLSHPLQAKLLRVLETKELKPLGETRIHKIDVRVVASTNQDLKEKIARNQFREDLYHRLNVISIVTPSLSQIPEDIPLIANHYLAVYCSELNVAPKKFSDDALKVLASRRWSGNVRELQNQIKRVAIFSKGEVVAPEDFGLDFYNDQRAQAVTEGSSRLDYKEARRTLLRNFDIKYISDLLKECNGNVSSAAKKADLERQSLQHLMRKYGINSEKFRDGAQEK